MIHAVIFDLGHTLWDIGPQRGAIERAYEDMRATLARRLGHDKLPEGAAFQRAVRDVLAAASETYFMSGDHLDQPPSWQWLDRGCRALGLALDEALLRDLTPPLFSTEIEGLVCAEGTREAVAALADAGYVIGCVTNTLADTAAIRAMLRRHGFEEMMRSVVVSADEGRRKPHRSLFEKAMRELDARPRESVFVGDSPLHDIGGARGAGMHAVLTRQYVTRPLGEDDPQPDAVVGHVREIPSAIAEIEGRMRGEASA